MGLNITLGHTLYGPYTIYIFFLALSSLFPHVEWYTSAETNIVSISLYLGCIIVNFKTYLVGTFFWLPFFIFGCLYPFHSVIAQNIVKKRLWNSFQNLNSFPQN